MKMILKYGMRTLACLCFVLSLADCRKSRRYKRGNGRCGSDTLAEYNLSFFGDWSKEAFPRMYPKYRPHAQWSKLYGLTHGTLYKLWSEGELATPAVKKFVEERSTLLLDRQAQGYNDTYDVFTAAPIRGGLGRSSVRIFSDGKHSKVSFLVKIIPSPDWFVGVNALDLCKNGRWRRKVYAQLRPMDAGTDKGLTYTSPNWPAHPQQKIFSITPSFPDHPASSFYYPGKTKLPRIAHAIFERVTEYHQRGPVTSVYFNTEPNVEVRKQAHELTPKMSASELDEDEIPLNTKIDEALREKLESDIQAKLRTAPRQTMFLQKMLKQGGRPLADQSSEEDYKRQYPADKVAYHESTTATTTTTTTTPMTTERYRYYYRSSRNPGIETSRRTEDVDDSDIDEDDADTYYSQKEREGKSSEEESDSHRRSESSYQQRKLYVESTTRPSYPGPKAGRSQHSRSDSDYGAAYSMSSAETVPATKVYDSYYDRKRETPQPHYNRETPRSYSRSYDEEQDRHTNARAHPSRESSHRWTNRPTYSHTEPSPEPRARYDEGRTTYKQDAYNRYDDDDGDEEEEEEDWDTVGRDNVDEPSRDNDFRSDRDQYRVPQRSYTQNSNEEQLDCLVSEWTPWTPCSKTCGFGVKTRSRYVTQHSHNGGMNCPHLTSEVLCGSMKTCKWNYFSKMFNKYKQPGRRRRRRRHHHG